MESIMEIIVEEIIENEDDTCTVYLNLDHEATKLLIEIGFIKVLTDTLEMRETQVSTTGS
jgi:hypothetical protein